MTEDEASEARLADRGHTSHMADKLRGAGFPEASAALKKAMHDRDRFHRERDYWREQCAIIAPIEAIGYSQPDE